MVDVPQASCGRGRHGGPWQPDQSSAKEGNVSTGEAGPTKSCPYCGEQVLAIAVKCKHCQSALGVAAVTAPRAAGDGRGALLLLLPWIGVALCWFWVAGSPLITASNNLTIAIAIVVLGCAIAAAMDATALGFGVKGTPAEKASGAGGTFAGVALLWPIVYPMHMHLRSKHGAPNRAGAAVMGMLAFSASAIYFAVLINDQMEAIQHSLRSVAP